MILDATCAANPQGTVNIDIRAGQYPIPFHRHQGEEITTIVPTIQADLRYLPLRDAIFDTILYDPPFRDFGNTSFMAAIYGTWTRHDFITATYKANMEFARCLHHNGYLLTKIMGIQYQRSLTSLLTHFTPLTTYRNHSLAYHTATELVYWSVFVRKDGDMR